MPNLNAALGIAQLENLPTFLQKRSLALRYHELEIPYSKWLKELKNYQSKLLAKRN